jgi:hypothetical protein
MTLCTSHKLVASVFRAEILQPGRAHSDCVSLALELKYVEVFRICNNLTRADVIEGFYRLAEINSLIFLIFRTLPATHIPPKTARNSKINLQYKMLIWLALYGRDYTAEDRKVQHLRGMGKVI